MINVRTLAVVLLTGAPSWLNAEHAIDRYLFPLSFADCSIELRGCAHPVPTKFEGFFALPIYLGIILQSLNLYYGNCGKTLEKVALGGLADQAGVKAGDVVIKVNGETIQHLRHCEVHERLVKAGNEFTLTVLRNLKFEQAIQQE